MGKDKDNATLIELEHMRLLAHSGTFQAVTIMKIGPGWIFTLQAPKETTWILRSQRSDSQPRYFKSAEATFRTAKSIGISKVLVMLDTYRPEQGELL